jgi:hypothetical protein
LAVAARLRDNGPGREIARDLADGVSWYLQPAARLERQELRGGRLHITQARLLAFKTTLFESRPAAELRLTPIPAGPTVVLTPRP